VVEDICQVNDVKSVGDVLDVVMQYHVRIVTLKHTMRVTTVVTVKIVVIVLRVQNAVEELQNCVSMMNVTDVVIVLK
jgi:hypothetical protein